MSFSGFERCSDDLSNMSTFRLQSGETLPFHVRRWAAEAHRGDVGGSLRVKNQGTRRIHGKQIPAPTQKPLGGSTWKTLEKYMIFKKNQALAWGFWVFR